MEIPTPIREAAARAVSQGAEIYWSGGIERIEFTTEGFARWLTIEHKHLTEQTPNSPALRCCITPGCLNQYAAIAAVGGEKPARPEWSAEGWRTLIRDTALPAGGHICPAHVDLVTAHLPRRIATTTGRVRAACECGGWDSGPRRWHGAVRGLWEEHILEESGALQ